MSVSVCGSEIEVKSSHHHEITNSKLDNVLNRNHVHEEFFWYFDFDNDLFVYIGGDCR